MFFHRPAGRKTLGKNEREVLRVDVPVRVDERAPSALPNFLLSCIFSLCFRNGQMFFHRPAGRKTLGKNEREVLRVDDRG